MFPRYYMRSNMVSMFESPTAHPVCYPALKD